MSSIEKLIKSTVENSTGLTCQHNVFTKSEDPYCVFNYFTEKEQFDNMAIFEYYYIQVHIVAPHTSNINALKRKLKIDLEKAGFSYPTEENASDDNSQHYVLETNKWWQIDRTETTEEEQNNG